MLHPLFSAITWVLRQWHSTLTHLGLASSAELTWALSIVLLVLTLRAALIGTYLHQARVRNQGLALVPSVEHLKAKHKGDRIAFAQAVAELHNKQHGFNPIVGWLPMLIQAPLLLGLNHVLRTDFAGGPLGLGVHVSGAWLLTAAIVAISAVCLHLTQRLALKNLLPPRSEIETLIRKVMPWGLPVTVILAGFVMPLGVLVYLATTNAFTTCQQAVINRVHPVSAVTPVPLPT